MGRVRLFWAPRSGVLQGETFVLAAAALGAASGVVDRGCCWGGVDRLLLGDQTWFSPAGATGRRRCAGSRRAAARGARGPAARDLWHAVRLTFRFLYGIRNVAAAVCGLAGMGWGRFAVLNFFAAGSGVELRRGGWFLGGLMGPREPVLGDRGDRRAGAVGVHRPACLAAALPAACDGLINPFAAEICAGRTADRRRDRIRGQGTADSSGTRVYQRPNSSALVSLFHVVDAGCKSPVCLARRTSGGPPSRPRHEQRLVPLVWRRRWLINLSAVEIGAGRMVPPRLPSASGGGGGSAPPRPAVLSRQRSLRQPGDDGREDRDQRHRHQHQEEKGRV